MLFSFTEKSSPTAAVLLPFYTSLDREEPSWKRRNIKKFKMENPSLNPPNSSSSNDEEWKVFFCLFHIFHIEFDFPPLFLCYGENFSRILFFCAMLECYTQQSTSVNVRSEEWAGFLCLVLCSALCMLCCCSSRFHGYDGWDFRRWFAFDCVRIYSLFVRCLPAVARYSILRILIMFTRFARSYTHNEREENSENICCFFRLLFFYCSVKIVKKYLSNLVISPHSTQSHFSSSPGPR